MLPTDQFYSDVDRVVTKYPFDQNRAMAQLAEGGFRRGPDGRLVDSTGHIPTMEIWSTGVELNMAQVMTQNWQSLGIDANPFTIPANRGITLGAGGGYGAEGYEVAGVRRFGSPSSRSISTASRRLRLSSSGVHSTTG